MKSFIAFSLPKFTLLALMLKKPAVALATIPGAIVVAQVVSYESVWSIFKWFIIADLLTGILASYYDWKKSDHIDRWFFGKGEGFNSSKAKMFGLKLAVYLFVPQLLVNLQKTLLLKNFKYDRFSDAEFELATIVVLVFCLFEGFSIFHENLPRCGFNIWKIIKKMIGFYKEVKNEIKE